MKLTVERITEIIYNKIRGQSSSRPFVIAVDGRAASGKTTFAGMFDFPIIHTDDFFHPKNQNGVIEMSEHIGNFDIERFKSEVVNNLKNKNSFEYGVFDCAVGKITDKVTVTPEKCIIIEGAYCLCPLLTEYADLKLFFDISKETQKNRIISRNGLEGYERFSKLWIPAEERYFEHFAIQELCDYVIYTED